MTDGLSRRDFAVLAGVGLLASSCGGDKAKRLAGPGGDWGSNPHLKVPPDLPGDQYPNQFAADYAALLYIGLLRDWSVRINHASFHIPGSTLDIRLGTAITAFSDIVRHKGDITKNRFKHHNDPSKPTTPKIYRRANGEVDAVDFNNFKFKSPTELFILIHQVDSNAANKTKITLDNRRLISFSSRLLAKDASGINLPAQENHSYFAAEPVSLSGDLNNEAKMIRVQNWARGEYGTEINVADVPYSMNIHFIIAGENNVSVPMVFDPDTGNGTGHEP